MKHPENKIWILRQSTGLTQSQFCKLFQIPRRTLQAWENNERHPKPLTISGLENAVKNHLIKKGK